MFRNQGLLQPLEDWIGIVGRGPRDLGAGESLIAAAGPFGKELVGKK
jgi:hypothetical protein